MSRVRALAAPAWPLLALGVALAGCASRSAEVAPRSTDPAAYASWGCQRLHDEIDRVQARAADVAYAVDARAGNNMIALGLGVSVFWPALLAMRPDGDEAQQLATLRGRFDALQTAAKQQNCGEAPAAMSATRAQALPVTQGDRLVYEDRPHEQASPHRLGMRLLALRRDGMDFQIDLDGRALPGQWRQDLSGNTQLEGRAALLGWQRLLKPDLQLGQVLAGDLAAAGEPIGSARVRGQVVALGPQLLDGRRFEVAVIELFGDAPAARQGVEPAAGRTRLEGVMAVDRRSGLLLRLELRSANPDFSLRRRLVAVEGGGG